MESHKIIIDDITPGSIAEELDIKKGDKLISVNGEYIEDILEYKYLISDEYIVVEIEKPNGEVWELDIEKDYDEDLGFVFNGIIDNQKSCCNKCIFCFIDQLPKGMRKTLYFKDDDTRLSFLQGNFVTLTNLKDKDIEKIIRFRISPINISVHTTDMELRKMMLNNKNAGRLLEQLKRLKDGGIEMKAQIVLCPDINDGKQLDKTVEDLYQFYPQLNCMAAVPVGITKYREKLYPLKEYDKIGASKVINQVKTMQDYYIKNTGSRFIFLSDEFYIIASKELPPYESYEDFSQIENGVGIIRMFQSEIQNSLDSIKHGIPISKNATIITGEYAVPYLKEAANNIMNKLTGVNLQVIGIENDFFGSSVKVAGLITGRDTISQLKGRNIFRNVLIPDNMLRRGEKIFLDDLSIEDIERALDVKIIICNQDGSDLVQNILEKC